jgi:hypothetical protein
MPIQLPTYVRWHSFFITPFAFGLAYVHAKNNFYFETWKVRCAKKFVGTFMVCTLRCGLCKILWGPTYLAMECGANPLGILKSRMVNRTCYLTSNSTCFRVLLACFSYCYLTYSKSFLVRAYNFSHPLTIFTTSLKWFFVPWGWQSPLVSWILFPTLTQTMTSLSPNALWSCNKTLSGLNVHPKLFDRHSHRFVRYWFNTPLTVSIWPLVCGWNAILNDNFMPTFVRWLSVPLLPVLQGDYAWKHKCY